VNQDCVNARLHTIGQSGARAVGVVWPTGVRRKVLPLRSGTRYISKTRWWGCVGGIAVREGAHEGLIRKSGGNAFGGNLASGARTTLTCFHVWPSKVWTTAPDCSSASLTAVTATLTPLGLRNSPWSSDNILSQDLPDIGPRPVKPRPDGLIYPKPAPKIHHREMLYPSDPCSYVCFSIPHSGLCSPSSNGPSAKLLGTQPQCWSCLCCLTRRVFSFIC